VSTTQFLVLAKQPVPGRVKTRLCPPCTHEQAAAVAAASLADTIGTVAATPAARRTLVISGRYEPPPGWSTTRQMGAGLAERIIHAFVDTAGGSMSSVLIGMDTPQLTPDLLTEVADGLRHTDAVIGHAEDGGWWTLALRDPRYATVLRDVPMSTQDTGARTMASLQRNGLTVRTAPTLRDVDNATDAWTVARECHDGQFASAVWANVPPPAGLVG
jgi:uncharacterized protein